ncbi:MAG: Asp-tRNA(Asn)/Glu-tRNA(Gln) amidotransferase subunit GatC [Candidatus Eiseniibacteriota bacterium]
MSISREDLERIAELARLEIPAERAESLSRELSAVLAFAGALQQLDLSGCEPSVFAPPGVAMRQDQPDGRTLDPARATAAAPESEAGFFLVPPVVDVIEP